MDFTDDQIETVARKYHAEVSYAQQDQLVDQDQRHSEVLAQVGMSFIEDPDILFDLLGRGVQDLIILLDTAASATDTIQESLPDVGRTNTPVETIADLALALRSLERMTSSLEDNSKAGTGNIAAFRTGIDAYLQRLKPSISVGTTYRRPGVEARALAEGKLSDLGDSWDELVRRVPLLRDAVINYLGAEVGERASLSVVSSIKTEVARIHDTAKLAKPSARANTGTDDFLHLVVAKDMLNRVFTVADPTAAKITGDTLTATGACTPAEMLSGKSGPFHILAANVGFDLVIDETLPQSFTLPSSPPAEILSYEEENFVLAADTKAAKTSINTGPYTTPVRATAADLATTGGSKVVTSAGASFLSSTQVGDYIVITGAISYTGYVEGVLDNNTLVLDTAAASTQTGLSYSTYRDNRFRIVLRGVTYSVALTVGIGVLFSVWKAELIAGLGGAATVTDTAGLIKIEDAGAGGPQSTIYLYASEIQGLLGMPVGLTQGTDEGGLDLGFTTDQGIDTPITMTPGTYTAAQMVSHINTLAAAKKWKAEADGTRVRIRSLTEGQYGTLEVTTGNATLGFTVETKARGNEVLAEEVIRYLEGAATVPAVFDLVEEDLVDGYGLSVTNGSSDVSDSGQNFTTLGVGGGDVLHVLSGPNQGHYHIASVSGSQITLDADWIAGAAVTESDVAYRVERRELRISSEDITLVSEVKVTTGAANDALGFTDNQLERGTCLTLKIIQDGADLNPLEEGLTTNDLIDDATDTHDIDDVDDAVLTLVSAVANNYSKTTFTITSKSALAFVALKAALVTWWATQYPRVKDGESLDTVVQLIGRALNNPTSVYIGDAQGEVGVVDDVLTNASTGLRKALEDYTPLRKDETTSLLAFLKEEKATRLLALLKEGDFDAAFLVDALSANRFLYLGDLMRQGEYLLETGPSDAVEVPTSLDEVEDYG